MRNWLDRVCALRIKTWRYIPEVDPTQKLHIGPMAEDWKSVMGIGDGTMIDQIDATGVMLKAIQELTARVAELENKLAAQSAGKHDGP